MRPRPGGFFTSAKPSVTPQLGGVPGFRDLLPLEAEILREAQESLLAEMRRWGYRHVITPLVENMDVLDLGLGVEQRRRLFKFADGRGDMVALVGERTVPVARLVAGKLRGAALPLRLCYAGPVLSTDEGRFQQRRETYQLGAELVGAAGPVAAAQVRDLLVSHGIGYVVNLDLGAIRDFDYYTGVIFEGYGPDFGRPVAQGGRYDALLARFGRPAPATGFMIQLDLVSEMLTRAPRPPALKPVDAALAWTAPGLNTALRLGSTLRLFGMRAVVDTQTRTRGEAKAWWHAIGAANLVYCRSDADVSWSSEGRRTRNLPPEQVAARLAGGGD